MPSSEGRNANITRGAIRGLGLPLEEREAKLANVSPEAADILGKEIGVLQWLQIHYYVYLEQGTWPEVVAFLEASGGTEDPEA